MPVSRNRHRSASKKKASQYLRNLRERTHAAEAAMEIANAKATYAREHGKAAYATLLAVLRACGGVVVSQADVDAIAKDYDHLEFTVQPIKNGLYDVTLVDRRETHASETPGESLAETPACATDYGFHDTDTTSVPTGPPSPSPAATASPSTSASEGAIGE